MREFPSHAEILKTFEDHPRKDFRLRELLEKFHLRSSQARELKAALRALLRSRKVVLTKHHSFVLAPRANHSRDLIAPPSESGRPRPESRPPAPSKLVPGRLIGHRDGFGFVVPDDPSSTGGQDIYIREDAMSSALHGDRVGVHVVRVKADGRREGRIVRIIERAQKTVVGEFRCGQRANVVLPFDTRIPHEIVIPRGQEWPEAVVGRNRQFGGESEGRATGARLGAQGSARELENMIVDVEITNFAEAGRAGSLRGRVVEILGRKGEFGVDVEIIIRKFHLPHRFPADVLDEAGAAPETPRATDLEGRRDFRSLPIVTIDGETAKDFDDAVYVERMKNGHYWLEVHIADVAHYVRPGTALDREARLRGTSVYFPDRAVPMLPLELSNGICSLNPHAERLTMSALMEIDGEGAIVAYELVPGVIRSAERMTYTAVRDILAGEPAACDRYRWLVEKFKLMEELAKILMARRDRRGSIDFDLPEPEIEFDAQGRMVGVTRSERSISNRIIEEFMLAANETVAGYLEQNGVPSLYRIHEKPDPKKVIEFEEIAATFGYSLGVELPAAARMRVERQSERQRHPRFHERPAADGLKITSRHYQRLTQRIAGKPEERILSYLMLRSLKQARYSEENVGHFALASPTYTHFTSPIRRYPDLIVHRILKSVLASRNSGAGGEHRSARRAAAGGQRPSRAEDASGSTHSIEALHALGVETSESERRAQDAERELMEWKKVSFMAGRMGEEFDALIISLTKRGLFVELADLFIEGFVPIETLEDDRYVYRESARAIVGEHSKRAYRLGARVRARLDRIDPEGNKLQFSLV